MRTHHLRSEVVEKLQAAYSQDEKSCILSKSMTLSGVALHPHYASAIVQSCLWAVETMLPGNRAKKPGKQTVGHVDVGIDLIWSLMSLGRRDVEGLIGTVEMVNDLMLMSIFALTYLKRNIQMNHCSNVVVCFFLLRMNGKKLDETLTHKESKHMCHVQ